MRKAYDTLYAAVIDKRVAMKIGPGDWRWAGQEKQRALPCTGQGPGGLRRRRLPVGQPRVWQPAHVFSSTPGRRICAAPGGPDAGQESRERPCRLSRPRLSGGAAQPGARCALPLLFVVRRAAVDCLPTLFPCFLLPRRSPNGDKVDVGQKEWKLVSSGFQYAVWEAVMP